MTETEEQFRHLMDKGHSAAWDQLWDQAAGFYRQALELMPESPQALNSLALALFELQDYKQSLSFYLKAARVAPQDALPFEKLSQLFERLGNNEQAVQAALQAAELYLKNREVNKAMDNWQRVAQLNPDNMRAHSMLALINERLGQKPEAVAEHLALASLYQRQNDPVKAFEAISHALQILPANLEARQAMAMLKESRPLPRPVRAGGAQGLQQKSQAPQLAAPEISLEEKDKNPIEEARQKAMSMLAGMLFEGTEEEQSEQGSRRGLNAMLTGVAGLVTKQADRTLILLHLGQAVDMQIQGQKQQAAEELERAVEAGLKHSAVFYDLGLLRAEGNNLESAVRYLQYAVNDPQFTLGARLLLGQIYQKLGRTKDAAVEFFEALRLADSSLVSPEQAEDLQQLYDPLIEAQTQLADAQSLAHICANIAELLIRPQWRQQLKMAREQMPAPADGGPLVPLAEILTQARSSQVIETITNIYQLARSGYYQSAMEEAFYALQYAPTYLPLHDYMGEMLIKMGRIQGAIAKFNVVAHMYSMRGESRRAIDLYRRIVTLAPMDLKVRKQLIEQLVATGELDEALKQSMDFAEAYYDLADLEMVRKTYAEALQLAQQPKVDRSWRVKILHRMADIDLQSLDWRQAVRGFEQIRSLQPDDEQARSKLVELNFRLGQSVQALAELDNYIAYLLPNGQREQAVAFLENLSHEHPDQPGVRWRLAEFYKQVGRIQDAVTQLDSAGEVLLQSGDRAGAARVVEAILALGPPNASDYQRLLNQLLGK